MKLIPKQSLFKINLESFTKHIQFVLNTTLMSQRSFSYSPYTPSTCTLNNGGFHHDQLQDFSFPPYKSLSSPLNYQYQSSPMSSEKQDPRSSRQLQYESTAVDYDQLSEVILDRSYLTAITPRANTPHSQLQDPFYYQSSGSTSANLNRTSSNSSLTISRSSSSGSTRHTHPHTVLIRPYNLGDLLPYQSRYAPTRCWFQRCLAEFDLKPGNYFETYQEAKYGMWLYFTAKYGIQLRQMRATGLRSNDSTAAGDSPMSDHVDDSDRPANFSYQCKICKKMLFVVKKKVSGSYNDGVNNNAPNNVWVVRTIINHPDSDCNNHLAVTGSTNNNTFDKSPKFTIDQLSRDKLPKMNSPHTIDLMETIRDQVNLISEDLEKTVVCILQDIYVGQVYDEQIECLTSVSQNGNGQLEINEHLNSSLEQVLYIRKRQSLMSKMVRKKFTSIGL